MLKTIRLTCNNITYEGTSIGDDIHLEIEVLGVFFSLDKKISLGQTVQINKLVGEFETSQKMFETDIRLKIVEKDVVFNDIGIIQEKIIQDITETVSQKLVCEVSVQELQKTLGKATARFKILLTVEVVDPIKYIVDEGGGWLRVIIERTGLIKSLPAYLKVKLDRSDEKKEYFTVLEGFYKNVLASVKRISDGTSNLLTGVIHEPPVHATYSISKKTFTIQGESYATVDYPDSPWSKGVYDIEIPDSPHEFGQKYPEAKRPTVWFKIGHDGDRYLHTGEISKGCITIIETKRWPEIYNALIKARKGDSQSVGTLEVVD